MSLAEELMAIKRDFAVEALPFGQYDDDRLHLPSLVRWKIALTVALGQLVTAMEPASPLLPERDFAAHMKRRRRLAALKRRVSAALGRVREIGKRQPMPLRGWFENGVF